jgi:hypothetical protein
MSEQSRAIFEKALYQDFPRNGNAEALLAAAYGHIGASRRLEVILEEYNEAMEGHPRHTPEQAVAAQEIADELVPVRAAHAVVEGYVPRTEE